MPWALFNRPSIQLGTLKAYLEKNSSNIRVDSLFREGMEDSSSLCTWLLEEAEVAMVPGVAFGDDRFVRMSYATSDELLEEGIRRLARAVEKL